MTNSINLTTFLPIRIAAGALAIALTCGITAAASAKSPQDVRANIEASIEHELALPKATPADRHGTATLAITVGADGRPAAVRLLKSAGFKPFDQEAIRTANRVSYPEAARGKTVAMVLGFNEKVSSTEQAKGGEIVTAWLADQNQKVMLASETTARQPDS